MRHRLSVLVAVVLAVVVGGCQRSPLGNRCGGLDCGEHGHCVDTGSTALCQCDPGFHAEGVMCIADTDGGLPDTGLLDGGLPDVGVVFCGDGVVDPGEACDDGNSIEWDGCNTACECVEWQVNTHWAGHQHNVKLASATDGSFVIVYQSEDHDGDGYGIFGQRFDSGGAAVGGEFQSNTVWTDNQAADRIAMAPDGRSVVVWRSAGQDAEGTGIYAQRYGSSGAAVGSEILCNETESGDQDEPGVAMATDGHFVVVYASQDSDYLGIFGRLFHSDGTAYGAEFPVNTTWANVQTTPRVAMAGDGRFVVVWASAEQEGTGFGYGVFGQRYLADGSPSGPEFAINTYVVGDQRRPSVAMASDGSFMVVWMSDGQSGGAAWGVYGRRYDASGTPLVSESQINPAGSPATDDVPTVSMATDGSAVVAWTTEGGDGSGGGIVYRRYNASGVALGQPVEVNVFTAGDQNAPFLSLRADGSVVVGWASDAQDGDAFGVFARIFNGLDAPVCRGQ